MISDIEYKIGKMVWWRWVGRRLASVTGGQVRAKSGYLGGIFGRFGALRGAPGVTDG